jgi:hypothetical protein
MIAVFWFRCVGLFFYFCVRSQLLLKTQTLVYSFNWLNASGSDFADAAPPCPPNIHVNTREAEVTEQNLDKLGKRA